jgi:hypothetical protein
MEKKKSSPLPATKFLSCSVACRTVVNHLNQTICTSTVSRYHGYKEREKNIRVLSNFAVSDGFKQLYGVGLI